MWEAMGADSHSVCRPEVPPFVENIAPEPVLRARNPARCGNVAVGRFAGRATRERRYLSLCHSAHAIRSADGMAPAACWASWADVLHMVQERLPVLVQSIVVQLEVAAELVGCLRDWRASGNTLDRHGFVGCRRACDHVPLLTLNLVSGARLGNMLHLPFLIVVTSHCVARVVPCQPNTCWSVALWTSQVLVGCPPSLSFRSTKSAPNAHFGETPSAAGESVDCCLTVLNGTDRHAPTQAGCALGPQHQNTQSSECAGRPESQFASTRKT